MTSPLLGKSWDWWTQAFTTSLIVRCSCREETNSSHNTAPLNPEADHPVTKQGCLHPCLLAGAGAPCPYPLSLLTGSLVQDTVVWGVVEVDKVSPGGTAIALAGCCEVGAILGCCHLHSAVIAPPQVVTCAAEV